MTDIDGHYCPCGGSNHFHNGPDEELIPALKRLLNENEALRAMIDCCRELVAEGPVAKQADLAAIVGYPEDVRIRTVGEPMTDDTSPAPPDDVQTKGWITDTSTGATTPVDSGTLVDRRRPRRSTGLTRTIEADKEGIIGVLKERVQYQQTLYENEYVTRRARDRARGEMEGLEFAISLLDDWVDPPEAPEMTAEERVLLGIVTDLVHVNPEDYPAVVALRDRAQFIVE